MSEILEDSQVSNAVKEDLSSVYDNESFRCATGARLSRFERKRFKGIVESDKHLFSWKSVALAKEYLTEEGELKMLDMKLRKYWHMLLKAYAASCFLLGMILLFLFSLFWKHYTNTGEWVAISFSMGVCFIAGFSVLYIERGYLIAKRMAKTVIE